MDHEVLTTCGVCVRSGSDMRSHQLLASAADAWCCNWTRDRDDWEANNRRWAWRLVRRLGSAWTDLVDSWHHTVTTSGICCDYQFCLHLDHSVQRTVRIFLTDNVVSSLKAIVGIRLRPRFAIRCHCIRRVGDKAKQRDALWRIRWKCMTTAQRPSRNCQRHTLWPIMWNHDITHKKTDVHSILHN